MKQLTPRRSRCRSVLYRKRDSSDAAGNFFRSGQHREIFKSSGKLSSLQICLNTIQVFDRCANRTRRTRRPSGLDLQQELARSGAQIPMIFMTGYGNIPMSVRAIKAGAIEFLTKPFSDEDLFSAIDKAIRFSQRIELSKIQSTQKPPYP